MRKIKYLIIALLCTVVQGAWAQSVDYIECSWSGCDTGGHVVKTTKTYTGSYTTYNSNNEDVDTFNDGWYVLSGSFTFKKRICIDGDVKIILADGCTATFKMGICIKPGKTLTIYAQSDGDNKGYLNAEMNDFEGSENESIGDDLAAIGGNPDEVGGSLVIHGGHIYAKPVENNAAGIGGSEGSDSNGKSTGMESVTIYDGTIEAKGKSSGAGIGCGEKNSNPPTVTIYGGNITAKGGKYAAGIGGSEDCSNGTIKIYGGTVNATGGEEGTGIGSGDTNMSNPIYIYGGTVTATGGKNGAGIGSGFRGDMSANIYIYRGTITAAGGNGGAGIGSGRIGSQKSTIYIYGGTVTAKGGEYGGAGIGSGLGDSDDLVSAGRIKIYDGEVYATGGAGNAGTSGGAGIGGGGCGNGGTLTVYSGYVEAKSNGAEAAAIGGGSSGKGGNSYFYGGTVKAILTNEAQHGSNNKNFAYIGRGGSSSDLDMGHVYFGTDMMVSTDGTKASASERESACQTQPGAIATTLTITACEHPDGLTLEQKDDDYHNYRCNSGYCAGYDYDHTYGSDLSNTTCTTCGHVTTGYNIYLYKAKENGSGYDEGTRYMRRSGTSFTMPSSSDANGRDVFVGWIEGEPTGGESVTLGDDEDKNLIMANEDVTITKDVAYKARYMSIWSGDGSGTEDDPFIIATTDDLNNLASVTNQGYSYRGRYFRMVANLDYSGKTYTPIGTQIDNYHTYVFNGTFDGDGYTISGISINTTDEHQGVFGFLGNNGTVKNLTLTETTITANSNTGGIVGINMGTIENCHVTSSVTIQGNYDNHGGIVGKCTSSFGGGSIISGCTSAASVQGKLYVGGIVGDFNDLSGEIKNCLYLGNSVTGSSYYFGALCGSISRGAKMTLNFYKPWTGGPSAVAESDMDGAQKAYTVSSGTNGLALNYGTATKTYDHNGIEVYTIRQRQGSTADVLLYDGALYTSDKFNGNLPMMVLFTPEVNNGKKMSNLSASGGTLTSNSDGSYWLSIDSQDITVTATLSNYTFTLYSDQDNTATITAHDGHLANVTLSGTTLYRDGKVQTICLPFDVDDLTGTPLEGFTVQVPTTGDIVEESTVFAVNCNEVTAIEARKPYIIKWTSDATEAIANPVFNSVVINGDSPMEILLGDELILSGTYAPKSIGDGGNDYYVTTDCYVVNTPAYSLPAQQVFIHNNVPEGITEIRLIGSVVITPAWDGSGTEDDPYLIKSSNDFDALATFVNERDQTYSGKYFKLTANISPTKMVGQGTKRFQGRFDGNGHTITVNYTGITEDYCAPFRCISGATIKNLNTTGTIETSGRYAAGVVAYTRYYSTIENCHSSVTIRSSRDGWAGHGGILGLKANVSYSKPTIEGCVFDGKILTTGEAATTGGAGIVGYTNGQTLTIKNCLYKPAALADGETAVTDGSATLYINASGTAATNVTCSDCYYTTTLGTAQGTQSYTVESGTDGLTLDFGDATKTYAYDGVKVYGFGLSYGGTLFSGSGQSVTFTPEADKEIKVIQANGSPLAGNGNGTYTLTMPAANVSITATLSNYDVTLYDGQNNSATIAANDDYIADVTISGRTLYKDGAWNTLCLPFDVDDISTSPLAGATIMELDTENEYSGHRTSFDAGSGTLYLYFKNAEAIEAGKPYLIKWADGEQNIMNPEFSNVEIESSSPETIESEDGKVSFKGNFDPVDLPGGDASNLYLGAGNKLYWPSADRIINAFRGYFHVDLTGSVNAVRAFVLNFGGETTGISPAEITEITERSGAGWYDLQGRKLQGKPTEKGIYIYNGKKRVIK